MSLEQWFQTNNALNWMPQKRRDALIQDIKQQKHYSTFCALMTNIDHGNTVSGYTVLDLAIQIAQHTELDVPKDKAVYFSGGTQQDAEDFVASNDGHHVIHSRPAGAMLELLSLFGDQNDLTVKEAYQPWYILATRYAETSKGNITAIVKDPQPQKTFRSVELNSLLENNDVTHINGTDKALYANLVTGTSSLTAQFNKAKEMLNLRHHNSSRINRKHR